jgi:two-component system LytT family response regulator
MNPLRVLIVDDEPLARQTLRLLLGKDPEVTIVGECADGDAAVAAIRELSPALVFLDIQMPGKNGFEVLQDVGPDRIPAVVFVTAYDSFAIKAFDVQAVDYLVKPFDDERFAEALRRAKASAHGRDLESTTEHLIGLLETYQEAQPQREGPVGRYAGSTVSRMMVKSGGRTTILPVEEIDCIEAEGNYARLHTRSKDHLIRETLHDLTLRLDPTQFIRIHRSAIVRIGAVKSLEPLFNGDYAVRLQDGKELTLSRTYRENVLAMLGKH